jgi:kinesin family protein 5
MELDKLIGKNAITFCNSHLIYEISSTNSFGDVNKFIIADLASSERVRKSVYLGSKLVETVEKSSSLIAFSKCISFLVEDKRSHICYEESRLTLLLKEALGGNCMTLYVISVSHEETDREKTLGTLVFGRRLKNVNNFRDLLLPSEIPR